MAAELRAVRGSRKKTPDLPAFKDRLPLSRVPARPNQQKLERTTMYKYETRMVGAAVPSGPYHHHPFEMACRGGFPAGLTQKYFHEQPELREFTVANQRSTRESKA